MSIKYRSAEKIDNNEIFNQTSLSNIIWFILFLWGWAIPSAYFWNLAQNKNVLLPYLPRIVWLLPGLVWRHLQLVYIILIIILPLIYYFFLMKKKRSLIKIIKPFLICSFIIITITNFLWGVTLYKYLF